MFMFTFTVSRSFGKPCNQLFSMSDSISEIGWHVKRIPTRNPSTPENLWPGTYDLVCMSRFSSIPWKVNS